MLNSNKFSAQILLRALIVIGLLVSGVGLSPAAVAVAAPAQETSADAQGGIHIDPGQSASGDSVQIQWQMPTADLTESLATGNFTWPDSFGFQPAGDYLIPIYAFQVVPTPDARGSTDANPTDADAPPASIELTLSIYHLETREFTGRLPAAPSMVPNAADYTLPAHAEPVTTPPLPNAPLYVVRAVNSRGHIQINYALSPIYQDAESGRLLVVTALTAEIGHATLPTELDTHAASGDLSVGIAGVDAGFSANQAVPPSNALANRASWKINVSVGGIQELKAADLAAAGLQNAQIANLALYRNGQEVALHIIDANNNGVLDGPNDVLRFYAPTPGDRWNKTDIYWLAQENNTNRRRMAVVSAPASDAPIRTTAMAEGVWRQPRLYNSTIAGPSADSWFHLDAIARNDVPVENRRFVAEIGPILPLATADDLQATVQIDASLYRLEGSNFQNTPHTLRYVLANGNQQDVAYEFSASTRTLDVAFEHQLAAPTSTLHVTFLVGERPLAVLFDRVRWQQPVSLNFRIDNQNRGADFSTVPGDWRYRLRNLPGNAVVYEVTDPILPRIRQTTQADSDRLLVGEGSPGRFIVAGPGTLHTPEIVAHSPATLAAGGAHALYIAPAMFHAGLAPLVEHRQSQGYEVRVVDVQQIYDGWSFGQVSPDAIRNFLRHAVATWRPAPISVVLVGDGTSDPHSYLGHGNPTVIPPYMARVDPWLGETACDNCFGQLNGAHPLDESTFAMDIWVGRLPVINAAELRNVVNKILRYELATDHAALWRRISVQITDDYFFPEAADGSTPATDNAGDFVASAESINALKPRGTFVRRNYFNRQLSAAQLNQLEQITHAKKSEEIIEIITKRELYEEYLPWFTHDPDVAWNNTVRFMNQGAGLVTYTGHANHWKWASTTSDSQSNHLFGLWDVNRLNNQDRLFIALSMTCYTSQFTEPAPAHFTLDEHLLLHAGGGAAAVWGPAGLSVVHGHDMLQEGFHNRLWSAPPMTARMGELLEAGYAEVRKQSCCQDVLKTFLLLGDPLMPARVNNGRVHDGRTYIPSVFKAQ